MQSHETSHQSTDKPQQQQGSQQQKGLRRSQPQPAMPTPGTPLEGQRHNDPIQGEGDYRSDRRYTESVKDFVDAGKVDAAARKAKPQSQQEADEMRRAEQEGASHAKDGKSQQSGNAGAEPRE